jgi:shikimate dehydrogenase
MKTVYGVIGDPISHSLSPAMHNAAFEALGMDCIYLSFRVRKEELRQAVEGARCLGFGGLNVTIPHTEAVMELATPDGIAREIGAANTIDLKTMRSYNTDAYGAITALEDAGVDMRNKKALVLGAGGASRAVAYSLLKNGASVVVANRTAARAEELAQALSGYGNVSGSGFEGLPGLVKNSDVIVNTTSVGMQPDIEGTLITRDMLDSSKVVFDIVYRPLETRLLREAKSAGALTIDGISMLARQGERSFEIWTGVKPPAGVMEKAAREALR